MGNVIFSFIDLSFYIVRFVNESDAPGIIASNWLTADEECLYPNVKTNEMRDKLLRGKVEPDASWGTHHIRIIGTYETYDAARLDLPRAEETSDLERIVEGQKRKAKKRHLFFPGEEESDEEIESYKPKSKKNNPMILKHKALKINIPPHTSQKLNFSPIHHPSHNFRLNASPISHPSSPNFTTQPGKSNILDSIQNKLENILQFMGDVSEQMGDISKRMNVLEGKINEVLSRKETLNENDVEIDFSDVLPSSSMEHFLNIEQLMEDHLLRKKLVKFLSRCGRKDLQKTVNYVMSNLMVDEVAQCYNLTGKSTKGLLKNAFVGTRHWQIVLQSCQNIIKDSTTDKIKESVANWLHQAKTRIIRRAPPVGEHILDESV